MPEDTYAAIADVADSPGLTRRVAACAAKEGAPGDSYEWAWTNRMGWASAPGWGAAWESATVSNPEEGYDPGTDPAVVSDGMILTQVQAMLAAG